MCRRGPLPACRSRHRSTKCRPAPPTRHSRRMKPRPPPSPLRPPRRCSTHRPRPRSHCLVHGRPNCLRRRSAGIRRTPPIRHKRQATPPFHRSKQARDDDACTSPQVYCTIKPLRLAGASALVPAHIHAERRCLGQSRCFLSLTMNDDTGPSPPSAITDGPANAGHAGFVFAILVKWPARIPRSSAHSST